MSQLPIIVETRVIIVVRAHLQAEGNAIAQVADPTTDDRTFTTPLCAAPAPPWSPAGDPPTVAYWCSWAMTNAQRVLLLAEMGRRFVKTITPLAPGARVRLQDDYWVFEGAEDSPRGWKPQAVLDALGMAIMPSEPWGAATVRSSPDA